MRDGLESSLNMKVISIFCIGCGKKYEKKSEKRLLLKIKHGYIEHTL